MPAARTACNPTQLQKLLDDDLPPPQQQATLSHVSACRQCQRDLETLAAGPTIWRDAQQSLRGLGWDEPSYCDRSAIESLSRVGEAQSESLVDADAQADVADETLDPVAVSLTFLDRSDNPAMLGRLGEFEILELIGSGGMGIVLKGYDHELNRYVAVKVLHPHCATSAAGRRRFVREAQAAAAVVHPHVIAIHAVDAQHQPPYLVMPFVPGESLQQRLDRNGPLELLDVLRIGQQIAEGLAAAHAQGLAHRDIKPANILLERNVERVVITDFGLARAADDASLTRSGVISGTPQYMSPEQARGEAIDVSTDLFSLGSVLYTMLAGHSPFRAETSYGVLRRVCDDAPRSLRESRPDTPVWLETLVEHLLAKRPADRPDSAAKVAEWLRGCLAHVQHPDEFALPAELVARLPREPSIRLRTVLCGSAAVVVLAIVVASGLAWRWNGRSPLVRGTLFAPESSSVPSGGERSVIATGPSPGPTELASSESSPEDDSQEQPTRQPTFRARAEVELEPTDPWDLECRSVRRVVERLEREFRP